MKFCEQCGAQVPDGALVCPACGRGTQPPQPQVRPQRTQQPQPPKPSKGNWPGQILFLLLGIVLAGVFIAALLAAGVLQFRSGAEPASVKAEGPGYTSAEEAALAYAEALKAGNMDAMLSTFAVESYVAHFNRAACFEDVKLALFQFTASNAVMPSTGQSLALALNLEGRRTQITQSIYSQYMSRLVSGTEYEDSLAIPLQLTDPEDTIALLDLLQQDPAFGGMTIGAVLYPDDFLSAEHMEAYQRNMDRRAEWFGAQDIQDICLALTIDGEDYYLFLSVGCYNGTWRNLSVGNLLGSFLGMDSLSGGLVPADEIE